MIDFKKEELAEENLGLVYQVIKDSFKTFNQEEREEYIAEGMLGLAEAIDRYKENEGYKFSTFAYICIKNRVLKLIQASNTAKRKKKGVVISLDLKYGDSEEMTLHDMFEDVEQGYSYVNTKLAIEEATRKTDIKDIEKIVDLREKGFTMKEIANKVNSSYTVVQKRLNKFREEYYNYERIRA